MGEKERTLFLLSVLVAPFECTKFLGETAQEWGQKAEHQGNHVLEL